MMIIIIITITTIITSEGSDSLLTTELLANQTLEEVGAPANDREEAAAAATEAHVTSPRDGEFIVHQGASVGAPPPIPRSELADWESGGLLDELD
mmetsp:Transcript_40054/g.99029  ORF Transcript_40054/g.99029 Transcript_40054/m.99029 type:complete len:95 (+) Transcript_40054:199-483(+)